MTHPWIVVLDDVVVRLGGAAVLGPVSLRISPDERWVVLGPNGCGKTTLSSVTAARLQPSTGTATVLGVTFGRGDLRELGERIGHLSHAVADRIAPAMRVVDVVLTGKRSALAAWFQRYDEEDLANAAGLLADVGCSELAERPIGSCSQGERQRVLLARAMFGNPPLVVLDEPSAGLDLPARERLITAIDSGSDRRPGPALLLTTHHLEEIPSAVTHAALMQRGRLIASGPIDEVLTDGSLSACFEMPIHAGRRAGRWYGVAARG